MSKEIATSAKPRTAYKRMFVVLFTKPNEMDPGITLTCYNKAFGTISEAYDFIKSLGVQDLAKMWGQETVDGETFIWKINTIAVEAE